MAAFGCCRAINYMDFTHGIKIIMSFFLPRFVHYYLWIYSSRNSQISMYEPTHCHFLLSLSSFPFLRPPKLLPHLILPFRDSVSNASQKKLIPNVRFLVKKGAVLKSRCVQLLVMKGGVKGYRVT